MKKFLVGLFAAAVVAGTAYAVTITNYLGQVIEVTTLEEIAAAGTGVTLTAAPSVVIISVDTALNLSKAQAYSGTPGQLIVSVADADGANSVWACVGTTNWVSLNP